MGTRASECGESGVASRLTRRLVAPDIVTVEQMRRLEAAAAAAGVSERTLQATAARGLAELAQALGIEPRRDTVVVLVGPGNNGRDAMLAGAHLARRGYRVALYLGPRHAVEPDELQGLRAAGARLALHAEAGDQVLDVLDGWLQHASLAIDGLLGIGARGALRSPLKEAAERLNRARQERRGTLRVLAVDIPSGIDADDGGVEGVAVQADVTAALGAVKAGTLRFPAAEFVGELICLGIDLPPSASEPDAPRVLDPAAVASLVPSRDPAGHKGSMGKVLVVGGSHLYLGAPILSALGAARSGCGLVALAVPSPVRQAAAVAIPEATYLGEVDPERDPDGAAAVVAERLGEFEALLVGPGLGRSDNAGRFVRALLSTYLPATRTPTVVDADALYVLARWGAWWEQVPSYLVLTPHHGEMSRLSGQPIEQVAQENWIAAQRAAEQWRQVVVLKGPHTVVVVPRERSWVYPRANPALATAGSGDVLAGLIAGLIAQGADRWDAARLGVVAHALAAQRLVARRRWRSLLASDLCRELPRVLSALAKAAAASTAPHLG